MNEKLSLSLAQHGLEMANPMQKAVFGTLKSGADTVILAPKNAGKTTTMVMLVIQQLTAAFEDSPRALIVVPDKERLLHMEALLTNMLNIQIYVYLQLMKKQIWMVINMRYRVE